MLFCSAGGTFYVDSHRLSACGRIPQSKYPLCGNVYQTKFHRFVFMHGHLPEKRPAKDFAYPPAVQELFEMLSDRGRRNRLCSRLQGFFR